MNVDYWPKKLPYKFLNKDVLLRGRTSLGPDPGCSGFPNYPETPQIVFEKKLKVNATDLQNCGAYWLISDKLKSIFEEADAEAFAFMPCNTRYPDSSAAPIYWLCDIVRKLDALDEGKSNVGIVIENGFKLYRFIANTSLTLRADVVQKARVFRLKYRHATVCCDAELRKTCVAAKVRGVRFEDIVRD